MNRKEFLRICAVLGIVIPSRRIFAFKESFKSKSQAFNGKVIIIGAGAAGITSGYLLHQLGIDFEIFEASGRYGGRLKSDMTFSDFPIPLGAEWLHVHEKELKAILNNPLKEVIVDLKKYEHKDLVGYYKNGNLTYSTMRAMFGPFYKEQKFINSTWLSFFETNLLPEIKEKITFGCQIVAIDYSSTKVILTNSVGKSFESDKVILTVPLKQLQNNILSFTPALPKYKLKAIQKANIWGGIKVFISFSEKFYPTFTAFPDSETKFGQKYYYDAAYGQNTGHSILGLFAVGRQAEPYQEHTTNEKIDFILNELDAIFEGKASRYYQKHIVQNWNDEPYINAAYLADVESSYISKDLSYSVEDKLFFAGTSYTRENDWGSVHNATRSAKDAVEEIVKL